MTFNLSCVFKASGAYVWAGAGEKNNVWMIELEEEGKKMRKRQQLHEMKDQKYRRQWGPKSFSSFFPARPSILFSWSQISFS